MGFVDFINGVAKNEDAIEGLGFPKTITQGFLAAAEELNCVIATRLPGGAATTLIDEGYDLKGFFIKMKSCDWGPMAGFVCQLPPLNKKGAAGIDFNLRELNHCLEVREELLGPAAGPSEPFVQLKISGDRKNEILDMCLDNDVRREEIIGIASDPKKTVVIEFLLKKEGDLWAIYHGNIFCRRNANEPFQSIGDYSEASKNSVRIDKKVEAKETTQEMLDIQLESHFEDAHLEKLRSFAAGHFFPVYGIMNPYPPYDGDKKYLNAVAGDYDLFAVWPVVPSSVWDNLARYTEIMRQESEPSPPSPDLFSEVAGKELTIQSTRSRNVFVEFVPGLEETEHLEEDPKASTAGQNVLKLYGNINEQVFLTAQTLNNLLCGTFASARSIPNRVFHSDEGGRPGVKEVEYPFAVFLPSWVVNFLPKQDVQALNELTKKQTILVIESHNQFVSLIEMLKKKCYVLLNFGWLIDLFAPKPNENDYEQYKESLKRIFVGEEDKNNELTDIICAFDKVGSEELYARQTLGRFLGALRRT